MAKHAAVKAPVPVEHKVIQPTADVTDPTCPAHREDRPCAAPS